MLVAAPRVASHFLDRVFSDANLAILDWPESFDPVVEQIIQPSAEAFDLLVSEIADIEGRILAFSARQRAPMASPLASRLHKAALDCEDLHRRRASAQCRLSQPDDPKVRTRANSPQEVGGDKQRPADCLAMLLKPRRHVHRVAKIGDLTV
jgi:hypothetical protein